MISTRFIQGFHFGSNLYALFSWPIHPFTHINTQISSSSLPLHLSRLSQIPLSSLSRLISLNRRVNFSRLLRIFTSRFMRYTHRCISIDSLFFRSMYSIYRECFVLRLKICSLLFIHQFMDICLYILINLGLIFCSLFCFAARRRNQRSGEIHSSFCNSIVFVARSIVISCVW